MSDDEDRRTSESEEESEASGDEEEEEDERTRQKREQEERRRQEEARREEAALERQRKQEEKKRQEAETAKKQRKPGQKRKGLGGLSPEKKKLLKQLIMQKAADEMKNEIKRRQEERDTYLRGIVQPLVIDGLDDSQLAKKVRELYDKLKALEGEKYDWEEKLRRQDFEINELTIKVNDVKGKFVKPVLKKVTKTETHRTRFQKKEGEPLASIRSQLKSTGQSKFALEEKEEGSHKADWRDQLKPKEDEAEKAEEETA